MNTKTQDFFSKNLAFRQFFTMCIHNFLVKKYVFQTILLKITNIFEKLKNFLKTQGKFL